MSLEINTYVPKRIGAQGLSLLMHESGIKEGIIAKLCQAEGETTVSEVKSRLFSGLCDYLKTRG